MTNNRLISISVLALVLVGYSGGSNNLNLDQRLEPPSTSYTASVTPKQIWYVYDKFSDSVNESLVNGLMLQEKVRAMGYQLNLTDHDSNLQVIHNNGSIPMDLIIVDEHLNIFSSTYLAWDDLNYTIPIIATGFGGLSLYDNLGLDVGWGSSCGHNSDIEFFNRTHPVATIPYRMNATFTPYTDNSGWDCVYKPWLDDPSQEVEFFAGGTNDNARAPMTYEENRYFYWGLHEYAKWTKATEQLFHNVLNYLIGPGVVEVESGCPPPGQLIDLTKLGVSKGDTYTYEVSQYTGPINGHLIAEFASDQLRVTTGDEYSITITNDTPNNVFNDAYVILYSISSHNQTIDSYSFINDPFGTDFIVRDWNFMECKIRYQFIDLINTNDFTSFNISNLEEVFVVEWTTITRSDGSEDNFEYIYNKTDGVRMYRYENFLDSGGRTQFEAILKGDLSPSDPITAISSNITSDSSSVDESIGTSMTHTISTNIDRSSTISSSSMLETTNQEENLGGSTPLPGFEFNLFFVNFVILYILQRRRNKK